jgi:tRNA(Glu) U13 pseudouridine synthase TruD
MTDPKGEPAELEAGVLERFGLKAEMFRQSGRLRVKGARRPIRVKPIDVELAAGVDEHGSHITIAFTLPPGAFATVLLREIMKNDGSPAGATGGDEASDAQKGEDAAEDEHSEHLEERDA